MNWAKIEGYPYVIHPCGTILRIWKHKTKEMKHKKEKSGYTRVTLCKNGKKKTFLVHRLLALAFIFNDDPVNKTEVDHIRGKHIGNSLDNLKWATRTENMRGFRSNRGVYAIITKGGIRKTKYGWEWSYLMSGVQKSKSMKNLEDLEKFRKEKLAEYNYIYT